MSATIILDETRLDDFRPGYTDILIRHFADKFGWTENLTRLVLRDALRFLAVCAIPATGKTQARILVCSPTVDRAVDELFLDVPLLMWLEKTVFGGVRLVHEPAYAHGISDQVINNVRYEFTVSLMQASGFGIDRDVIWPYRLPVGYETCTNGNDVLDCEMYALRDDS